MTAHHGGSRSTSAQIVGVQFGDEHKYEKYERISTFDWVKGAPGDERERLLKIGCGASVVAAAIGDASALGALVAAKDVEAVWRSDRLSIRARREVVDLLVSVTVLPVHKGVRFHPEQVAIEWKG